MAAPFVAVAPTAIWIAVSADGYYAGVAAWGIALLAWRSGGRCAGRRGGGGCRTAARLGVFLNYGLVLMAIPAVAVLLCAADWRTAMRHCFPPAGGAGDGRRVRRRRILVVRRLHPCPATLLAGHRQQPAVPVLELGEFGIGGVRDRPGQRRRHRPGVRHRGDQAPKGLHLLVLAALAAILFADLSMLSKAETERIWLPFDGLADRCRRPVARPLTPMVAGRQRDRRSAAQPPHSDELVAAGRPPGTAAPHPTPPPARSRSRLVVAVEHREVVQVLGRACRRPESPAAQG